MLLFCLASILMFYFIPVNNWHYKSSIREIRDYFKHYNTWISGADLLLTADFYLSIEGNCITQISEMVIRLTVKTFLLYHYPFLSHGSNLQRSARE